MERRHDELAGVGLPINSRLFGREFLRIDTLEDLLALETTQNFARAAASRGMSQPTFSRRIAALEAWAQATLVDRTTHRTALTPAGRILARRVEEAIRSLETGRQEAQELARDARNVVRLACTHMLSSTFFPAWFAGLEPDLTPAPAAQLVVADQQACEQLLRRGEVQLLLCHGDDAISLNFPDRHFRRVKLGGDTLVPVSVGDPGEPRFPVDGPFAPDFLAYRPESGLGQLLSASGVLERTPSGLRAIFHSHAALTLAYFARLGKGLAWLPLSLVAQDLSDGTLTRAGTTSFEVRVKICLIRPRARQSEAVEALWALATRDCAPSE